jgi:hypothetical protein
MNRRRLDKKYRSHCSGFDEKECLNDENCRYDDRKQRCLSKIINKNLSGFDPDIIVDLLQHYCTIGDLDILKYMYENGIDMNTKVGNNSNTSLLEIAITQNYCDIVQWLIRDVGIDITKIPYYDELLFEELVVNNKNNVEILRCLLESGVNINIDNFNIIIQSGNFQMNKVIIDHIGEFTDDMSKKVSEFLDNVFIYFGETNIVWPYHKLYTDDEYDEYVDIICYFLDHKFVYTGNNPYISDIIRDYYYMVLYNNLYLTGKISETGILDMMTEFI